MRYAPLPLALTLLVPSLLAAQPAKPADAAAAQTAAKPAAPAYSKACADCDARRRDPDAQTTRTFYFKYTTSPNDMNEITSTMRQVLSAEVRTVLDVSAAAITVRAIPEDLALAERTIDSLDRPKKMWRLTYTVTEVDGAKRLGSQHYSMIVVDGQQTTLKQGDRVPIVTGAFSNKDQANQTYFQYQDVGMSFDAQLVEIHDGARLRSDVAQTSLADDKAPAAAQDPVFRQSTLRSEAVLTPGKPLILGSMDMPGSTRHLEIEALMEPLP